MDLVTCDHCKTPIQKGEPYSLTEHGRLHASCFRQAQHPAATVRGPLRPVLDEAGSPLKLDRYDPIFVLART